MARVLPYRLAARRCYYSAPHRQQWPKDEPGKGCTTPAILWPSLAAGRGYTTPTCEYHARLYYGDRRIDDLIACGAIKVWTLSTEIDTAQLELCDEKGETEQWQKMTQ